MFQAPAIQVIAGKESGRFSCQTGHISDTFARPLASNSRGEAREIALLLIGLAYLEHPHNLAWGDDDGKTLYLAAQTSVYRIRLNIPGIRPSGK